MNPRRWQPSAKFDKKTCCPSEKQGRFKRYQLPSTSTSTSSSTLFHKTVGYNRLARKIAIANLGGPVKRKINWKEKKGKEKGRKTTILSYNK